MAALCAVFAPRTATAQSPTADDFNPSAMGQVIAMALQADAKVLVGGVFNTLGDQTRNHLGRLNPDGSLDGTFNPGADAEVLCFALQPDGKILAGGYFTKLGGQTRNCLGRLNADGTLDDTFNPGADSTVGTLLVQADGKILVGGSFTALGGQPRTCLARLNPDGSLDSTFNPAVGRTDGFSPSVYALAVQADGKVVVGGYFTTLGGQTRRYIGRLNFDGSVDSTFNPGANNRVYALAVQGDGKILVGGDFMQLGGQARNHIGRLNSSGTLDASFNPGTSMSVYSLLLQTDGKILVGAVYSVGRLNADGTPDSTFYLGVNATVSALAVQADGKVLVGGDFSTLGGQQRYCIGRVNNTAAATRSLGFSGSVATWLRGGSSPEVWRTTFEVSTNRTDWNGLGYGTRISGGWQLAGLSVPAGANIRTRGYACGGARNGSSWFVEDHFGPPIWFAQPESRTNEAGTTATFHVSVVGSAPLCYQWFKGGLPLVDGANLAGATNATLVLTSPFGGDAGAYHVVVSNDWGSLTSTQAILTVREPVIAVQPTGLTRILGENAVLSVSALGTEPMQYQWWKDGVPLNGAMASSLMLTNLQAEDIGAYWVVVDNRYGRLTSAVAMVAVTSVTVDSTFDPGMTAGSSVNALAVQSDGKILLGGQFSSLGGQPRTNIGRLHPDGAVDIGFSPGLKNTGQRAFALAVQPDGKILVAGQFTMLGGQPRTNLARLNASGTADEGFNLVAGAVYSYVYAVALQADGRTLVGGRFTSLGSQACTNLGRLSADGTPDASFNPGAGGTSAYVYALAVQADGKILVGGQFNTLGGQMRTNVGRLTADGTLDGTFNPGVGAAYAAVYALAVQPDGKILVGGSFSTLGGQPRACIGRLNSNGTVDTGFNPGAGSTVYSLAVQADGRILAAGDFTTLGGQPRNYVGRLNADGTLDGTFNVGANASVKALAVQGDGRIVVGGTFTKLGEQPRNCVGRINSCEPALQDLVYVASTLTWHRGGNSPEVWRATFEGSTNGMEWTDLGTPIRVAGGWQLTNTALPAATQIRARGFTTGGQYNASNWFIESVWPATQPVILTDDGRFGIHSNHFGFQVSGSAGSTVVVETATDLATWTPLATNLLPSGPLYFADPAASNFISRFYRARLK